MEVVFQRAVVRYLVQQFLGIRNFENWRRGYVVTWRC